MPEVQIEKLADDVGISVDKLLQQFSDAGIPKQRQDNVTESEKAALLEHLSKQHGGSASTAPKK